MMVNKMGNLVMISETNIDAVISGTSMVLAAMACCQSDAPTTVPHFLGTQLVGYNLQVYDTRNLVSTLAPNLCTCQFAAAVVTRRPDLQDPLFTMASYTLPKLPYAYDTLEPFVDAMTMEIHHSKHHQTYVNNLNAALEKAPELADLDLLALNKAVGTGKVPDSIATAVRNNGGGMYGTLCHHLSMLHTATRAGHWNHTFFWQVMGKPGDNNGPSAELKSAIDASFGSLDKLKADFGAAGTYA